MGQTPVAAEGEMLDRICLGPLISTYDLAHAGVLPPQTPAASRCPKKAETCCSDHRNQRGSRCIVLLPSKALESSWAARAGSTGRSRCWQDQGGATGRQAPVGSQQLEHRRLVSAGCELESLSKTQVGQPQGIRRVGSAIYQRMVSCLLVGSLAPDSLGAKILYIAGLGG